jgi:hypothetical protein
MIHTSETPNKELNIKLVGNTIKIGRKVAMGIKKAMNIKFHPILVDVTTIVSVSDKTITLNGKLTKQNGGICRCCGKTLKTDMSKTTGIGPVCSKFLGVPHPKTEKGLEAYKKDVIETIDRIGEFQFTIAKNRIVKWEGVGSLMMKM